MSIIMSKIWLLCSIVLWFGCKPKDLPTVADLNGDRITVKFSHQSTKAEMEQIARETLRVINENISGETWARQRQ